jgi:RNA polymerase sigma-70 factor (ECF subfamily)
MLLFARQFTRDLPTAEDILHDAFVAFWPKRDTATDAKAYLYTTIRNAALQHRRGADRRDKREQFIATPEATSEANPKNNPPQFATTSNLENDERQQAIQNALTHLPEPQRLVVTLKVWSDLTFAQIGEALSIPANTAASRWRAALQSLRQSLAQEAPQ